MKITYVVTQTVCCTKYCLILKTEDAERREKNLEEAKKIKIEQDMSLPTAKQVNYKYLQV